MRSEVYVLREKPSAEQVQMLLFEGRVDEAEKVFNLREPKGPHFANKQKKLSLDIGWMLFQESLDYMRAADQFKQCISGPTNQASGVANFFLDPRELVLMFKDLHEGSNAIAMHIKYPPPDTFKQVHSKLKMRSGHAIMKEEDALTEAKKRFMGIFEEINKRYVGELRNNP